MFTQSLMIRKVIAQSPMKVFIYIGVPVPEMSNTIVWSASINIYMETTKVGHECVRFLWPSMCVKVPFMNET